MYYPFRLLLLLFPVCFFISCSSTKHIEVREYPVRISNLGAIVNSSADDISPTMTANGTRLYFTSDRIIREEQKPQGFFARLFWSIGNFFKPKSCCSQDFWVTTFDGTFWSAPENVGAPINTFENEGSPSISSDGQKLFFAACERSDGIGRCDIYEAELKGKEWTSVINIGAPVNTPAWESQPSISSDGNTLFFVTDRKGGFGGLDIWKSEKGSDGKWNLPVNLGPAINTSGDETSPYIASDNKTLYFSSDGLPGLGGSDMFVSRFVQSKWLTPINLGKPLNSPDNDEFYTLTAEGNVVYFSSKRDGGIGGYDLYRAEPNPFPPGAVVVLNGIVRDKKTKTPLSATLTLNDINTKTTISKYKSNEYSGEYLIVLPAGVNYELIVDAQNYLSEQAQFDLTKKEVYEEQRYDFYLRKNEPAPKLAASVTADVLTSDFSILKSQNATAPGLTVEEVVYKETIPLLNYIFFEKGKSTILSRYKILTTDETVGFNPAATAQETMTHYRNILNILGSRLQKWNKITISLTGHNDNTDIEKNNVQLSQKRAEEVKKYLVDVWKINPDRISIDAKNLPVNKSSLSSEEGREENGRVEIYSDDPRLLSPIEINDVQRLLKPPSVLFNLSIDAEAGLSKWKFVVMQGNHELRTSDGFSSYPDSIRWNWKDLSGKLPAQDTSMIFTLEAQDNSGASVKTDPQTLPIRFETLRKKNIENFKDRTIEKVSLILFDFDKADVGEKNKQLLQNVSVHVSPKSRVLFRGYTDIIGDENYNKRLSEKRAEIASKILLEKIPNLNIYSEGLGESILLYPNDTPEGRFYCRTVQVFIETPRE